jgi:hypothetical protein
MIFVTAYATGLLAARRALAKLGLADKYEGVTEPDGTLSLVQAIDEEDAPRPFKCYLDVGLRRTSTGSRVFGALKGASDGGIFIPHSEKRFPGYDPENKSLDAEVLKKYIYGGHVAEYMESLEEEDDERSVKPTRSTSTLTDILSTVLRSSFLLTSQTGSDQRIWRRSTLMLMLPSEKILLSSPQKSRKTGSRKRNVSKIPNSRMLNGRTESRPRSKSSNKVARLLGEMRMMRMSSFLLTMFPHAVCDLSIGSMTPYKHYEISGIGILYPHYTIKGPPFESGPPFEFMLWQAQSPPNPLNLLSS